MSFVLAIIMGVMSMMGALEFENIQDAFAHSNKIEVSINGNSNIYEKDSAKFEKILNSTLEILKGSRQMPAFGVSIHKLTLEEMKKGYWVEFYFSQTRKCREMEFDALLIAVKENYQGFNIIRKINGIYEGRCYYIDLDKDMDKLFDAISESV